jgi:hypothetical protein
MRLRCRRSLRPRLSPSVRLLPEPAGNLDRVNAGLPPPRALVAERRSASCKQPSFHGPKLDEMSERFCKPLGKLIKIGCRTPKSLALGQACLAKGPKLHYK